MLVTEIIQTWSQSLRSRKRRVWRWLFRNPKLMSAMSNISVVGYASAYRPCNRPGHSDTAARFVVLKHNLLGYRDVLNRGDCGVRSPADRLARRAGER
jgi:hypothetical protein